MNDTVLSSVTKGVCTVVLNRPARLNAINPALVTDLDRALRTAGEDPQTRVIVLRGAGRAFCSGDDLIDFPQQSENEAVARHFVESLQEITRLMVLGDKVVVGAVHGWAVGGGFEWALNCDVLLMAQGTRCFMPETRLGMIPTGAVTALLPRLIGYQRARALILLGERIDATQAQSLAERIAELPPRGVRDTKRLLNPSSPLSIEEALTLETEAVVSAFVSPDTATQVAKFKD